MRLNGVWGVVLGLALAPGVALAQLRIHVGAAPGELGAGEARAASVEDALATIANHRRRGDATPAEIVLHSEVCRVTGPLVLDAGLVGDGLTIEATPGLTATISGGREITGLREQADGTWRATLEDVHTGAWWFEELFVDGRRAMRARHPNEGYARVVRAGADNRTSLVLDPAEVDPALLDDRSEIVFLHDWSISRVRIAGVDPATDTIRLAGPIGCAAPHFAITNFEPHPRCFVEGSPLLVDAPGEWALDRRSGELVYEPLPGERIDRVRLVAPVAPALLRVVGTADQPVRGLTVRGVRFAHANWPIPGYGYAEGQASFYEQRDQDGSDGTRDPVPAAVDLVWATECTLERCTIESVGGAGLWIGEGCRGCVVRDSVVRDCGANGIMVGEAAGRVVDGGPWWQNAPGQVASGNRVERCLVERCGRRFFGAVGIWIGLAEETTVARCEIRDLPYTGVSVGWRWDETPTPCRGTVVEDNHIHHVMQELSDGGGIYTLGLQPGTALRGNAIHDVPTNAGRAPSNGMFLDQGTTEIVIEGNIFWAIDTTPLRWHWTYHNTVRGNTFVLRPGQEIAHYNRATETDIDFEDNRSVAEATWSVEAARAVLEGAGPRR